MATEYQTAIQRTIEQTVTNGLGYDRQKVSDPFLFLNDQADVADQRGFTDDFEVQLRLGKLDLLASQTPFLFVSMYHKDYLELRTMYQDMATEGLVGHVLYQRPEDIHRLLPQHRKWRDRLHFQQYIRTGKVQGLKPEGHCYTYGALKQIQRYGADGFFATEYPHSDDKASCYAKLPDFLANPR